QELTDTSLRAGRLMASMFPVVMLIVNVAGVAVVWIGAQRIDRNEMTIGSLVAFLIYLVQILMSAMFATFIAVLWPRSEVCAERVVEVFDMQPSVVAPANPVTELSERATVRFDRVGFHYPGAEQPVLRDISFTASPGQTMAIIGSTGSGKTTILGLLARLFDVTSGSVSVDGVDIRKLDPQVLWKRIGMVPQRPYLFSGTVASNLRYANPQATDDELWAALDIAQATEFVTKMAEQLNAPIEQGGTNLSGGQRQRLAIARAIVRRPEIYLFDDSFSALDLATDAKLRAALYPATRDACVIVVAQRVSTIIDADQIVVLDDGQIVGTGTHDELLVSCPTYLEIVNSQLQVSEHAR
ncbi:MAG TPA: ABC transporter ATP-binding protein, partial [Ilumatobacteraceae bacterium]|nr:ABC transporter ATP-binding protein [Ilumatobacteraceae bacterium]